MVHDTRIVRLNAKHHPANLKTGMGDPVGLEGDTLVIETINMRPEQGLRGGSDRQRVTEWPTCIGPNKIRYKFTVDDPGPTPSRSASASATPPRARSTSTPATRGITR